ncbi:MAG: flagellar protein FlaG [Firmicutes bacterium]|nr:flagellar protein FlaG [Bacillota bacterium]
MKKMRIPPIHTSGKKQLEKIITGEVPKLAVKKSDDVLSVSRKPSTGRSRLSFQYNKELKGNVVHLIHNTTGETIRKTPSDAEADHLIRIRKLMGLHLDKKG